MLLVAGWLIDRIGVGPILICASIVLAMGFVALAVGETIGQATVALLLIGGAAAGLLVGSVVLMPPALGWTEPAAATNLGSIFFLLGAVAAPPLFTPILGRWGLRQSLLGMALLALVPALLIIVPAWPKPVATDHQATGFNSPVLWLAAAVLFFYLPLEHHLAGRCGPYLTELGHPLRLTAALTVGFWIAFVAMRVATGWFLALDRLAVRDFEPWYILGLAAFGAIALGNILSLSDGRGAGAGVILLGACLGPIMPTLLGMVYRLSPSDPGIACGTVVAVGWLGAGLVPPMDRLFAGAGSSARDRLQFPLALFLALGAAALVLTLIQAI
jgi:fucose permease